MIYQLLINYLTKTNIIQQIKKFIIVPDNSKLFFHYSGHGTQVLDGEDGIKDEEDGFDEAICPVDFDDSGFIIDDDIRRMLIDPLNETITLHAIMDCCHSATITDLRYMYKTVINNNNNNLKINNKRKRDNAPKSIKPNTPKLPGGYPLSKWQRLYNTNRSFFWLTCNKYGINQSNAHLYFPFIKPPVQKPQVQPVQPVQNPQIINLVTTYSINQNQSDTRAHVYVFGGCRDDQTSADAYISGENYGAMTKAFLTSFNKKITYDNLLKEIRHYLVVKKYTQVPQLSCGRMEI